METNNIKIAIALIALTGAILCSYYMGIIATDHKIEQNRLDMAVTKSDINKINCDVKDIKVSLSAIDKDVKSINESIICIGYRIEYMTDASK